MTWEPKTGRRVDKTKQPTKVDAAEGVWTPATGRRVDEPQQQIDPSAANIDFSYIDAVSSAPSNDPNSLDVSGDTPAKGPNNLDRFDALQGSNTAGPIGQTLTTPRTTLDRFDALQGRPVVQSEPITDEERDQMQYDEWLRSQIDSGNITPVKPTFFQKVRAELPQAGGGMAGAIAFGKAADNATKSMPPSVRGPAVLGASMAGAALGGMGGKGWQQYYHMKGHNEPMTLREIYAEQSVAGFEEATSELLGRGVAKGLQKVGSKVVAPVAKKFLAKGAKEAAELGLKEGAPPTLAQLTESRFIDFLESASESSFTGGKLQKLKTIRQPQALTRSAEDIVESFAKKAGREMSQDEVGEMFMASLKNESDMFRAASRSMYRQVDKLLKKSGFDDAAVVDITPLKKFAKSRLNTTMKLGTTKEATTLLEKVAELPSNVSFRQAAGIRTALFKEVSEASKVGGTSVAEGLAKQMNKITNKQMQTAGQKLPKDAFEMWESANKFYRTGKTQFNDKFLKTLIRAGETDTSVVAKRLFKPNAAKNISKVKDIVDAKTWAALKYGYVDGLISDAIAKSQDDVVPIKPIHDAIKRLGKPTINTIFTNSEQQAIDKLIKAGIVFQKPTQGFSPTGRLAISIGQMGAFAGAATRPSGNTIGFALTATVPPWMVGKFVSNRAWADMLVSGLQAPNKQATAYVRLANLIRKAEREEAPAEKME